MDGMSWILTSIVIMKVQISSNTCKASHAFLFCLREYTIQIPLSNNINGYVFHLSSYGQPLVTDINCTLPPMSIRMTLVIPIPSDKTTYSLPQGIIHPYFELQH